MRYLKSSGETEAQTLEFIGDFLGEVTFNLRPPESIAVSQGKRFLVKIVVL